MRYKTKQRMLQVLVKLLPVSKRKPQKGKRSFCASISIPKWSEGLGRRSLGGGANNFTHDSSSRVAAAPKTGDLEHKRGVPPSSVNELSPNIESRTICIYHECGLLSSHAPIRKNFGLIFSRTYHLKISMGLFLGIVWFWLYCCILVWKTNVKHNYNKITQKCARIVFW